jgi:DNA primase
MRFPPHFLDEIRARLPVSQIVGRKVALKKAGREYKGLSPFKVERTPSFTVNDQKGFYHCFASGEHGDIFKFLMTTEGLSFPEAVERLAEEAGIPMPKLEAHDTEREDERQRLYALLEASARFFETSLSSVEGSEARRYLEKRGLARPTIAEFHLGYAPTARTALKVHLAKAGFSVSEMITSGMLIGGDDIPEPYDRFRHRVMFPIQDAKGRTIAFGGRALDASAPAKYLNSPDTPLFHKGHVLFNAHRARPRAHETGRVIAVEGYMDAVALFEAGFGETVAPLGTALTEDQVKLLWRMAPEPILCFDGDSAGRKAAFRAIDTVLPHLQPGHSVSFAFLPDGLDPDDLIRQTGRGAMDDVLTASRPLIDVMFEREWGKDQWTTPERRARLEAELRQLVQKIADPSVRSHYGRAIAEKLAAVWGSAPAVGRHGMNGLVQHRQSNARRALEIGTAGFLRGFVGHMFPRSSRHRDKDASAKTYPAAPSASLLKSPLVSGERSALPYREALIMRTLLNHPWLAEDHAEAIAAMPLTSPALFRLRDAILSTLSLDNSLDRPLLHAHLSRSGLGKVVDLVLRSNTHKCDRFAEPETARSEVEDGWRHALELHDRQVGLRQSLEAAEQAWHEDRSEEAYARICELQGQLARMSMPEALDRMAEDDLRP